MILQSQISFASVFLVINILSENSGDEKLSIIPNALLLRYER